MVDYLGYCHGADDEDPLSDYDLCLDRELAIGVDAGRMGNEARFVNDFRGVAERPNVEFAVRRVPGGVGNSGRGQTKEGIGGGEGEGEEGQEKGEVRMALCVGPRDVKKGDELLVSYGKGFWNGRKEEV